MKHWLLKPYVKTFLTFGLSQRIEKPTRSALCTASLIDHITTDQNEKVNHDGVMFNCISDHDCIH